MPSRHGHLSLEQSCWNLKRQFDADTPRLAFYSWPMSRYRREISTYFAASRAFPACSSWLRVRTTRAGEPTMSEPRAPRCAWSPGSGCDDAAWTDDGTIHDDGPHADQSLISDGAGVDDGSVAHADGLTHPRLKVICHMHNSAVLNVGAGANMNVINIATENTTVPNAGFGGDGHTTYHNCSCGDECSDVNPG